MSTLKLFNIGQLVTYNTPSDSIETFFDIEVMIENSQIKEIGNGLGIADEMIDCKNNLVTPGFVDSHTHPVFMDSRDDEFLRRLGGESYESIAENGGGIVKSIQGVREATESQLIDLVKKRMDRFLKLGTTTIEAKSGYGLNMESELKSLSVLDKVQKEHAIDIVPTFMGAHSFPPNFVNREQDYVDLICNEIIPEVAKQGIAKFNDVFCEKGYFTIDQTRKILRKGLDYGLKPRLHADEFYSTGSAELAVEIQASSADHLMAISEEGIKRMGKSNVIATLLPGTTFFLGKTEYAPYQDLYDAGINVAIASDYNPGSCFIQSMPFIISLACIYLKIPLLEAIKASTYTAAKSLFLENKIGSIETGKNADIIVWGFPKIEQIASMVSHQPIDIVIKNGKPLITP